MKILLADDHATIRLVIKKILLRGFPMGRIEEVKDGMELVTKAISGQWDIVISDISMPVMSGLEALKEIRKHSLILPVVILSSHYEYQYIRYALMAGASGYVNKCNAHDKLCDAVREAMGVTSPTL
jgi:two-component system invasion response regulator UvrY